MPPTTTFTQVFNAQLSRENVAEINAAIAETIAALLESLQLEEVTFRQTVDPDRR